MRAHFAHLNALWAYLIVDELVRNGAGPFFISPGFRNSPLVAAVGEHKGADSVVHFDERGTAFHALGHARATRHPSVLICTSGTAAANYLPAVIEASQDMVPLILLTADRPPELRDTGANQTIDQVRIYGNNTRWFCDLPCPDLEIPATYVLTTVDQAVYRSLSPPAGPVHINCMFREPLAPVGDKQDFGSYLGSVARWQESNAPFTDYQTPVRAPSAEAVDKVAAAIAQTQRGILVVGRLIDDSERGAVRKLADHLTWPVFADVASGLRLGCVDRHYVPYYDHVLLSDRYVSRFRPDTVLHFGGAPTSKRLLRFVKKHRPDNYFHVANHPRRIDPGHGVSFRVDADPVRFCEELFERISLASVDGKWLAVVKEASDRIDQIMREMVDTAEALSEPAVVRLVNRHIKPDSGLFLASSMPFRDMDMFADPSGPGVRVACNRGASGIDGTVASAAGFAKALGMPVTLLVGDLALLHDLNSLALLTSLGQPFCVIVINNNGGGIFSLLPIAQVEHLAERFFGAPHGLSFESAASMFGLEYSRPGTRQSFIDAYGRAQRDQRSIIIEVRTDRDENRKLHDDIGKRVVAALEEL